MPGDVLPIRILLVGAGGLGTPVASALVSAWEATSPLELIILDPDCVELSNLHRQILFTEADIGTPKAEALRNALSSSTRNDAITVTAKKIALSSQNITELAAGSTYIIDATDSVATKFLINDYCVLHQIPFCYAGVIGSEGVVLGVHPSSSGKTPCLRCLFGDVTEEDYAAMGTSCKQAGVIGPVAGHVGFLQAEEVLRHFSKAPRTSPAVIRYSLSAAIEREVALTPSTTCPLGCGQASLKHLDLTDKQCPQTFVYTKLALEQLPAGTSLHVHFSSEESADNVSRSSATEGHTILSSPREVSPNDWHIILQKH